jgi:hypothetical protein
MRQRDVLVAELWDRFMRKGYRDEELVKRTWRE